MRIRRESLLEGTKEASGCTVIIDVFRAFTTAAFVLDNGAEKIIPVGDLKRAFELKEDHPEYVLMGERDGLKIEGFDHGNSPSMIKDVDFSGKTVVMSTSAGTQGLVKAAYAEELIAGSFVCVDAITSHIRNNDPETVTLVAMGKSGEVPTDEDELCAQYIEESLKGEDPDFSRIKDHLSRYRSSEKFFDETRLEFPEDDFHCAMDKDRFDFFPEVKKGEYGLKMIRYDD